MRFKLLSGAAVAAAVAMSAPASAELTGFATYTPIGSTGTSNNYNLSYAGGSSGGTGTLMSYPGSVSEVAFQYQNIALSSLGIITANMSVSLYTSNAAYQAGRNLEQDGLTGTITFKNTSALTYNGTTYAANTLNLLTVTIGDGTVDGGGTLAGLKGGQSASLTGSTGGDTVIGYTSDLLNFSNGQARSFSIGFDPLIDVGTRNGGLALTSSSSLANFRARTNGLFSQDPAPLLVGEVPEASTWAMMLVGFGAIGFATRRKQKTVVTFG